MGADDLGQPGPIGRDRRVVFFGRRDVALPVPRRAGRPIRRSCAAEIDRCRPPSGRPGRLALPAAWCRAKDRPPAGDVGRPADDGQQRSTAGCATAISWECSGGACRSEGRRQASSLKSNTRHAAFHQAARLVAAFCRNADTIAESLGWTVLGGQTIMRPSAISPRSHE